jgi:polyisoprenoid-binding protein YceI
MNFRTLRTALALFALLGGAAVQAKDVYSFDQGHSRIGFKIHHFIGVTTGKFTRFSGKIDIDREHPEQSSVNARIEVRSIDTGIRKRDDHLRSDEFFDVTKFPEITFRSRSVRRTGPQAGDVTGEFTMHGVTRTITLHVKLLTAGEGEAKQTRWSVTTEPLRRSDFGLMFSKTAEAVSGIGQEVTVDIEIEAVKAP